jgi:hypothetical protein
MVTSKDIRKPVAAKKPRLTPARRLPTLTPLPDILNTELSALAREMELVRSTTVVAAALLETQAADLDTDIAHLLRHGASNRLNAMLERTVRVLAAVRVTTPARQMH